MRMCNHLTCCDIHTCSLLGTVSHLSLSAVVDHVAPQITFCLLTFVQPITLKLKLTIMSKRRSSEKSTTNGKKQRKSITPEEKLDLFKKYETQ